MDNSIQNFYQNQLINDYENSHGPRFDYLISDLNLNKIETSKESIDNNKLWMIFRNHTLH